MVRGLEMPKIFTRASVEREDAIRKKVRTVSIRAIKIISRRSGGEIGNAALLVNRDLTPGICSASILPGTRGPGVVPILAGMGDCMKDPCHFSADDVVGTQIARR